MPFLFKASYHLDFVSPSDDSYLEVTAPVPKPWRQEEDYAALFLATLTRLPGHTPGEHLPETVEKTQAHPWLTCGLRTTQTH